MTDPSPPNQSHHIYLQPAAPADLDRVHSLLQAARAWLLSRGIRQWEIPFPKEMISTDIARGEVFLAYQKNALVGSVTLNKTDPNIWDDHTGGGLRYIHRLVIDRKFAGQGIGRAILHAVEQYALSQNLSRLRLDCWAGSDTLCRYYQQAGFQSTGTKTVHIGANSYDCRLFEKCLTD